MNDRRVTFKDVSDSSPVMALKVKHGITYYTPTPAHFTQDELNLRQDAVCVCVCEHIDTYKRLSDNPESHSWTHSVKHQCMTQAGKNYLQTVVFTAYNLLTHRETHAWGRDV